MAKFTKSLAPKHYESDEADAAWKLLRRYINRIRRGDPLEVTRNDMVAAMAKKDIDREALSTLCCQVQDSKHVINSSSRVKFFLEACAVRFQGE